VLFHLFLKQKYTLHRHMTDYLLSQRCGHFNVSNTVRWWRVPLFLNNILPRLVNTTSSNLCNPVWYM